MESSKDERNSTNNENENNGLNMILVVIVKIYQLFEYKFLPDEQPNGSKLPTQAGASKGGLMRY